MAKVRGTEKQKADKSDSKKSSEIKTKKDSGTKSSDKVSLTSKLNKTSKIAISKTNKSPAISTRTIEKKIKEVSWLKGLLDERDNQPLKKRVLKSGIISHSPASIKLRKDSGVDYAMFPWHGKRGSGYVRMKPSGFKRITRSASTMHFVVLLGKLQLMIENNSKNFESGSMITIPKGVHYGIKNPTSDTTFLRYLSICE